MQDFTKVILALITGSVVSFSFWLIANSAYQHGVHNRALVQVCIENDRDPVVGEYGNLEACQ